MREFSAFFIKGGKVVAVAGMNHDTETAAIEELMRTEKLPAPDMLREKVDLVSMLKWACILHTRDTMRGTSIENMLERNVCHE